MSLLPADISSKVLVIDLLCCRPPESESEDEDDMLTILLLDRKRRRRWFDTSHLYSPIAIPGNLAEAIWTSTDERFAEQVRLTRLQFLHVETAVSNKLIGPSKTRGQPRRLSPRHQLLMFLVHTAQCECTLFYEPIARCACSIVQVTDVAMCFRAQVFLFVLCPLCSGSRFRWHSERLRALLQLLLRSLVDNMCGGLRTRRMLNMHKRSSSHIVNCHMLQGSSMARISR